VLEVATRGLDAAMNVRNSRPKTGKKQPKERSEARTSPEPAKAKATEDKPPSPGEEREGP
jgi:PTH1 family peptidyl-tRNA hydrolase